MKDRIITLVSKIKATIKRKINESKRKSEIVLNYNSRSLSQNPLTYRCLKKTKCNFIELLGELASDMEGDVVFVNVVFSNELSQLVSCEQPFQNLKSNSTYKTYTYLTSGKFKILIKIPDNTTAVYIKFSARNNKEVTLLPGASFLQFPLTYIDDVSQLIGSIEQLSSDNLITEEKIEALFSSFTSKKKLVLLNFVYNHFKEMDYKIAYFIGLIKLRLSKSLSLALELKTLINQNGEMRELARFIDLVNQMDIQGWKLTSRRVKDEIYRLENGFSYNETVSRKYSVTNKVFYLLHNSLPYNSGGYATRTHGLLKSLNNDKYNVYGVTRPGFPSDHKKYISKPLPDEIPHLDKIDNVTYIRCSQKTRKSSLTISEYIDTYSDQLASLAEDVKPSIVHAASNHPNGLAAVQLAKELGLKSVYEVRGLWEITRLSRQDGWDQTEQYDYMAKMEAEACNNADKVLTITHALKDIMVERGVDPEKISVVPNCVNVDDFTPFQEKNTSLLSSLGINQSDIVIGYIGSIVNYEGLDDLLKALHLIKKTLNNKVKLLIVGDGAYLAYLVELVNNLDINDLVIFTGRVPHELVDEYYSLVDITPFPRKPYLVCEAVSPLKPFEAMASGKAVLVSSCSALTEIVDDGRNGLVFDKGNINDFSEKLYTLITDDVLRERLSKNGYEWVVENRDWSFSANVISEIYDELLLEES